MSITQSLNLIFEDNIVGKIYLDSNQIFCFDYSEEWLTNPKAFAVSQSLPLKKTTYTNDAELFFSNLIPEAKLRKLVAHRLGISEDNNFSFLQALGEDCAGAFRITNESVPYKSKSSIYNEIELNRIIDVYNKQPIFYFGFAQEEMRLSLAGAQDKVAIFYENKKIFLPGNGHSPSSHILKLPSKDYAYITQNEYYVSQLANDCEIITQPMQLLQRKKFTALLIERYDRYKDITDQKTHRLHQEDLCQALSISHQQKYEVEGGPSFKQAFDLIESVSSDVIEDQQRLLKWIFFNICVGNSDNHGKNLSLRRSLNNQWHLSPFYDLLCTKVYKHISKKQAMSVGGSFDGANLSSQNWQNLMKEINYSYRKFREDIALNIIDTLHVSLDEHLSYFKGQTCYQFMTEVKKEILSGLRRAEIGLKD